MICQLCQMPMEAGHACERNVRLQFGDLHSKDLVIQAIATEKKRRKTFDRRTMLAARQIVNAKIVRTKIVKRYGADAVLEAERRLKERQQPCTTIADMAKKKPDPPQPPSPPPSRKRAAENEPKTTIRDAKGNFSQAGKDPRAKKPPPKIPADRTPKADPPAPTARKSGKSSPGV